MVNYSVSINDSVNFSVGCDDAQGLDRVDWYVNSSFDHSTSISGYYDEATWSKQFTSAGTYNIGAVAVDTDSNTDEIAWVITVKAGHPSQEFFDDFHYSSVDDSLFLSFGWEVQDIENIWGPGIDGTWRKAAVTFVPSSQAPYDYAMRLTASTDGTEANTIQADVGTKYNFQHGTYVVLARLSDVPTGIDKDRLVEAPLFTISPYIESSEPYSECDFEYLPNGDWNTSGPPSLWVNSWERTNDNYYDFVFDSYAGWHVFLISAHAGGVSYSVDGVQIGTTHSANYAPDTNMRIAFQMWYIKNGLGTPGSTRSYSMDVDWIYFSPDIISNHEQILGYVDDFRQSDVKRLNTISETIFEGDLDNDGDVDGSDLAEYLLFTSGIELDAFASNFGMAGYP